jgi:two-component system phosphate regulon sensor histidine kinase PhoR
MPTTHHRTEAATWPIAFVGGVALCVLVGLALLRQLDPQAAAIAFVAVGLATALAIFGADRAAQVRYQALLRAAEERNGEPPPFAALVNALPDPIMVISANEPDDLTGRRYIFANSAASELLRLPRGEGLLVAGVRDPEVLEAVDGALFAGQDTETLYETGGAQARTFRAYARPLGLALDGRRLAVLVFRDETEVRQVARTRADFLANASHELRTPLASLSGFIETLRGHAKADAGARDRFLTIMQTQAERMSRLIDDLLSLSRIELNEHVAPEGEADLALCVTDVLDAIGPLARERGVTFDTTLPAKGAARIAGDRDQIIQVAQNLIDNALKYSPDGSQIRVIVEPGLTSEAAAAAKRERSTRLSLLTPDHPAEVYVRLRVGDQGVGIARENLPRLTERFYRVEGQKSGDRSGTGLGLAIVKHIVNRHRGGLTVESAPGEGTAFTAYFPLAAQEVPESALPQALQAVDAALQPLGSRNRE